MLDDNAFANLVKLPLFLGKKEKNYPDYLYLPLWIHLLDTGVLMVALFRTRVSKQEKKWFRIETSSDKQTERLFMLAGMTHDFGKASLSFQSKISKDNHLPNIDELVLTDDGRRCDHALSGMLILHHLGYNKSFSSLAGSHHGRFQAPDWSFKSYRKETGEIFQTENYQIWEEYWKILSECVLKICEFSSPDDVPELSPDRLMVIAGYLSEADWLASNTDFFPLMDHNFHLTLESLKMRWKTGWKKIGFPDINELFSSGFANTFGFEPNDFQKEVIRVVRDISKPGLLILEAPMGMGKTEAALQSAAVLGEKTGTSGVFFGLPTQASSNSMFSRFESWVKNVSVHPVTFSLTHGNAILNKEYLALPNSLNSPSADLSEDRLIAHYWFRQSRLSLFSDFVIGTIDTALMAALNHKYVTLRHAGLAGKVVILDEIHSYDAYMSVYLEGLLKWLGMYHLPVILLSATLPRSKRESFINSYLTGLQSDLENSHLRPYILAEPLQSKYSSITWTDGMSVFQNQEPITCPDQSIYFEYQHYQDDEDEQQLILNLLNKRQFNDGCIGIIVNTVVKAQKTGCFLKKVLPNSEIVIIHSRMTQSDRNFLESYLIKRTGKQSTPSDRKNLIVVGTLVLEQSLDIDFDLLLTELAPVDLLLQRVGRLHRHFRPHRPEVLKKPKMIILDTFDDFDFASQKIYNRLILRRTRESLKSGKYTFPADIPQLVSLVYDGIGELDPNDPDVRDYRLQTDDEASGARNYLLNIFTVLLKNDGLCRSGLTTAKYEDAEASVRLTEPTLEAVLVKVRNGQMFSPDRTPFSWGEAENAKIIPEELLARRIRCRFHMSDCTVPVA